MPKLGKLKGFYEEAKKGRFICEVGDWFDYEEIKWLIDEVEKLRSDKGKPTTWDQLIEKIDSLTKENAEVHRLANHQEKEIAELKKEIEGVEIYGRAKQDERDVLQAENAELKSRIEAGKRIFDEIKEMATLGGPVKCCICGVTFPQAHVHPCES